MFTSELIRAQLTGEIILQEMNQSNLAIVKDQSLNERAYGDLTGMNKDEARAQFGEDQVQIWRRSYDVSPPGGESLKDTYNRVIPFFKTNNSRLLSGRVESKKWISTWLIDKTHHSARQKRPFI